MKKVCVLFLASALLSLVAFDTGGTGNTGAPDKDPPFGLSRLGSSGGIPGFFNPRSPYNIMINYELGMHCVGFDISYCCIIPPYNSIEAQAIESGLNGMRPRLLTPQDGISLHYGIRDNTYSEGNKMKYWQVAKDVSGTGAMNSPNDNMANYVWNHLFIYQDLNGTLPEKPEKGQRRYVGREIPVNIDSGPTGKTISGGEMGYSQEAGGNIVFTDTLMPGIKDVPLKLTASHLWDALGLPLTAFNDTTRKGSIRTVTDFDFQPYQYATVGLRDKKGQPYLFQGKPVEFFGTEPVDISNCQICHSGQGFAASLARSGGLKQFDREYIYWKTNYPDTSEYMARLASASIMVLELHDKRHKTNFLQNYNSEAASNRLGRTGPVNCADCHGDNMSGNLQAPRPGTTGYPGVRARPLTEAVHAAHALFIPMPDKAGRTQNCQACHPTHWQGNAMNDFRKNPFQITDEVGNPRFSGADVRISGGGCYLRRDAHSNPDVSPPFFLSDLGKWYLNEISRKDENGKRSDTIRGLYCTHCHNHLTHELYRYDDLADPVRQSGKTLRNRPVDEIIRAVAEGSAKKFREFLADPVVGANGNPLHSYYTNHRSAILAKSMKAEDGKIKISKWNENKGDPLTYRDVSGGNDWWLSPGVPHCADCHIAPFVESGGGKYFPMDQPAKYSLFRYSKAHGVIACQSCHQSMHGLYPVRYEGERQTVDLTSRQQALQFSPDGKYAGPVTCAACHTVNVKGVPMELKGTGYENDYWSSVTLIHFMRDHDSKLPLSKLMGKFPYDESRSIVIKGW